MHNFSNHNGSCSEPCQDSFFNESLFAADDAILGAIVTSHTHRNVTNQTN